MLMSPQILSRVVLRTHVKSLCARGFSKAIVQAHEPLALRILLAPHKRGSQLKRVARSEYMRGQQTNGSAPHRVGRRNLIDVFTERVEPPESGLRRVPGDWPFAAAALKGRMTLNWRQPPHDGLCVGGKVSGELFRSRFGEEERDDRRAVPEH